MTVNTAGGVKVFIGTTVLGTDGNPGSYASDSFIQIGEVEDGGQYGDEAPEIKFTALQDARTRKFKGPFDAGTMAVVVGDDTTDLGQKAVIAAMATKFDYNFKVELNDALEIGGTPTISYFHGKVMSERRNVGNVMNVVKRTFNVAINSAITEVEAT